MRSQMRSRNFSSKLIYEKYGVFYGAKDILLFPEKEAKSVVLLRRRQVRRQRCYSTSENEAESVNCLLEKVVGYLNLRYVAGVYMHCGSHSARIS
jgi:hypothetical protein